MENTRKKEKRKKQIFFFWFDLICTFGGERAGRWEEDAEKEKDAFSDFVERGDEKDWKTFL